MRNAEVAINFSSVSRLAYAIAKIRNFILYLMADIFYSFNHTKYGIALSTEHFIFRLESMAGSRIFGNNKCMGRRRRSVSAIFSDLCISYYTSLCHASPGIFLFFAKF